MTAEDGSVREYKVMVTKETKEETESREDEADTTQSVGFVVEQKGDKKIIKNSYEFEVANPDDLERVPEDIFNRPLCFPVLRCRLLRWNMIWITIICFCI